MREIHEMENDDILMAYNLGVIGVNSIADSFRMRVEELEAENEELKKRLRFMVAETIKLEKVIKGAVEKVKEKSVNSLIDELIRFQEAEYEAWCKKKGVDAEDVEWNREYSEEWVCIGDLGEGEWRIDIIMGGVDIGRAIMNEKELRLFLLKRIGEYR